MVELNNPILITGASGLLGSALVTSLHDRGKRVVTMGRNDLDLSRQRDIAETIRRFKPSRIFNCAAHTDVENAEIAPELDRAVNADLPGVIAKICLDQNIPLVHFSSTGCYGNWKADAYTELDELRPLSRHHQAKLAGEEAVAAVGGRHTIFRLGWLYGGGPGQAKNFVWKRILEADGKSEMVSDDTQRGCPTYVNDVVRQVSLVVEHDLQGVYNAVASGAVSRCDYVRAIISAAKLSCAVHAGPSFPRIAPVSFNETAVNMRLQAAGLDIMPNWNDGLKRYIDSLFYDKKSI